MNIREWPAEDRPREKLLQRGRRCCRTPSCWPCCSVRAWPGAMCWTLRGLLVRFGGLRRFLRPSARRCCEPGIGAVKYAQLQALLEIGRRYLDEHIARAACWKGRAVRRYLKAMLRHEPSEVFGCLFLDTSTGRWRSRFCSGAPSTGPASTRGRWCGGHCCTTRPR